MNKPKPSLLERAAEIYDFASGLPMGPSVEPAPMPRPRPVATEPARPIQSARPEPVRAAPRIAPAVRDSQERVELDPQTLAMSGLLVPDAPGTGLADEVRLIKRRLLANIDARVAQGDERARLVLIASAQPGEGKTFMALNLALSLAGEHERSVLLVDGDNAKPELLTRLGVDADRPGFVDALVDPNLDPESLIVGTDAGRLSLLPPGHRQRGAPELLASSRARDVLDRLLAADPSRIVLIDSSPALASGATVALAQHVGQALVVVKADATSEAELKETLDLLSPCEHLSLVLNSTAFQVGRKRYGKYEEYR